MSDDQEPSTAIEQLVAGFNRLHRRHPSINTDPRCDFCSEAIQPGDQVTTYLSDADLGGYARPLLKTNVYAHRTYCQECDRQRIVYPHEGTIEMLFEATYQTDGTHSDWTARDWSPGEHGEPWDGTAVYSMLYGGVFPEFALSMALVRCTIGHEDIVDNIRLAGIDLREIFDENGTLIAPATKREQLQHQVRARLSALTGRTSEGLHEQLKENGRPGAFTKDTARRPLSQRTRASDDRSDA